MKVNLKSLIGKLTDSARRGLESAAGLCLSRTHYDVEPEHWLLRLAEVEGGDVQRLLLHCGVRPEVFARDLERAISGYNSRSPRRRTRSAPRPRD